MAYKSVLVALAVMGTAMCMNLDKIQKKNILYFESSKDQMENKKIIHIPVEAVVCPDGSECPDGNTCCELSSDQYGCCPLPDANCCPDHVHCCPNGYTCDVSAGTCRKGDDVVSWLTKVAAKRVRAVICDNSTECPTDNTCCALASGGYGCCPLPQATCCSDHTHCCPNGYTCDVSAGTCAKGDDVLSWLTKKPSKPAEKAVAPEPVVCPNDETQCPAGSTCCKTYPTGEYGCCPFSKIIQIPVEAVVCPDGNECPDGNTCCELSSDQYGCCPLPDANCCPDHVHCCPNGYTCDVSAGTCRKGDDVVSWLTKVAAKRVGAVICDNSTECPTDNTCCALASGGYGCCPLPQATCCSDHTHCCPNGYTCDVSAGTCAKGDDVLSWLTKKPSKPAEKAVAPESVVCPNDETQCPAGSTCCKTYPTGEYGCCPFSKAVCCSLHCCPEGYTCNDYYGTCDKGNQAFAGFRKQPSLPVGKNV